MILSWTIKIIYFDELMMMTTIWLSCYGKRNYPGWLDQELKNYFRSIEVIVDNLICFKYRRKLCKSFSRNFGKELLDFKH
jgi:hypothetical protein